jgi:hypothetical protein
MICSRVARWRIFKPNIQIWVNFGGTCNGRCWYILWAFGLRILRPIGLLCGHLVYFMALGYIFPGFGMLYQEKSGNPDLQREFFLPGKVPFESKNRNADPLEIPFAGFLRLLGPRPL